MSLLTQYHNFVIIIGWDKFATLLAEQLMLANRQVVGISDNEKMVERINGRYDNRKIVAFKADYYDFKKINKLPLQNSFGAYINLPSDRDRLIYIFNLRKYCHDLSIITPVLNPNLKESFSLDRKIFPISRDSISAKIFADYLLKKDAASYINQLLSPSTSDEDHEIRQYFISAENPVCNEMYGDIFVRFKKEYNVVLIGLSKQNSQGVYELRKNPMDETLIQKNDYLLVLTNRKTANELEQILT